MRFSPRKDLGGYACDLPGVASVEGVEITKPFVLLWGPNGSGKTSLLKMIRQSMSLAGGRQGRFDLEMSRLADPEECDGDIGKLAGFRHSFAEHGIPSDTPGIIDLGELGWKGERTWLLDSRSDTEMLGSSTFNDDLHHHVGLIMGGKRKSHGQALRMSWDLAIQWALGDFTADDPFDDPRLGQYPSLASLAEFFRIATGSEPGAKRPTERWLLLDEPETTLDAETLAVGLSVLVHKAEIGRFRVFCASHSFLFPAGLGDHPNVQVVTLGGEANWWDVAKRALHVASEPALIAMIGDDVERNIVVARERQRQEKEDRLKRVIKGLTKPQREAMEAAHADPENRIPEVLPSGKKVSDTVIFSLEEKGLAEEASIFSRRRIKGKGELTPLGIEVATQIWG